MYPYIDDIFHAQASSSHTARTCDISLHCHFKQLCFIINLKSALVPSQVILHLGALIDTAKGLVFPSPDKDDNSCNSGLVRPNPGLCSTHSSGDRAVGVLPRSCSPVHVSSSSPVESPESSLRHEGRSHFKGDRLVISSDPVSSGNSGHVGILCPRVFLVNPFLPLTP